MLVPRSREHFESISVNALAFGGTFFCGKRRSSKRYVRPARSRHWQPSPGDRCCAGTRAVVRVSHPFAAVTAAPRGERSSSIAAAPATPISAFR